MIPQKKIRRFGIQRNETEPISIIRKRNIPLRYV